MFRITHQWKLVFAVVVSSLFGLFSIANGDSIAQIYFQDAEKVEFDSALYAYLPTPFAIKRAKKLGVEPEIRTEVSIRLTGFLSKPGNSGPYPAIVLLHTCAGISDHEESWAIRLVAWGYVVLTVDSLTPRGLEYICDGRPGSTAPWNRALDAYGAKQYLSDLSFVDPGRIAVMGMSHGAMTVLEVVRQSTLSGQSLSPFRAAVAYYPLCGQPESLNAPTLVLVGEKDTWTPAQQCVQYLDRMEQPHELVLKVFTDAYHLFDHPEIDLKELGHTLRSDPEAAAQAILITKEFLGDHL